MALERLRDKLTKENLWIYILRMVRNNPMYGYEIAAKLRNELHIETAVITTYMVLYRMEREKLIQRQNVEETSQGLRKVYYSITDKGSLALEKGLELIEQTLVTLKGI